MNTSLPSASGEGGAVSEREVIIAAENVPAMALADLTDGARRNELWFNFAVHDIRQRFRRSILGPFWITLSMGIMVGALALVFGTIFSVPSADFIPYLAAGLIFWTFLVSTVNEGALAFISNEGFVRSVPMPLSVHFYRVFARNVLVLAHNIVIFVAVVIIFRHPIGPGILLFVPGFLLFCGNLFWVALLAALLSTRYRDIPQLISSLLQVVFFVTPIFWSASQIPGRVIFIEFNPAYHMIEIVRAPLLGQAPDIYSWLATGLALPIGLAVTLLVYRRAYPRIAYWV